MNEIKCKCGHKHFFRRNICLNSDILIDNQGDEDIGSTEDVQGILKCQNCLTEYTLDGNILKEASGKNQLYTFHVTFPSCDSYTTVKIGEQEVLESIKEYLEQEREEEIALLISAQELKDKFLHDDTWFFENSGLEFIIEELNFDVVKKLEEYFNS